MSKDVQVESGGSGWSVVAVIAAVILGLVMIGGCLFGLLLFGYSAGAQPAPFTYTVTGGAAAVSSAGVTLAQQRFSLRIEQRSEGQVLILDGAELNAPMDPIDEATWSALRSRLDGIAASGDALSIDAPKGVPYKEAARALEEATAAGITDVAFAAGAEGG